MSAIPCHPLIALLKAVKRLWSAGGKQPGAPRSEPSSPAQVGPSRHRHSAFFELP